MAISVGNTASSTAQVSVTTTTVSLNNNKTDVLLVACYRHSSSIIPTATYATVSMTSKVAKVITGGSVLRAEIFYLQNAVTGINNAIVTWNGTISDLAGVFVIALGGVDATTPIEATATGGESPGVLNPRSTTVTSLTANALIVDALSDRSNADTVDASQTQIGKVGSGDNMAASYKAATTATGYPMKWTPDQNIEDWAQAVVAVKAAVVLTNTTVGYKTLLGVGQV